MTCRVTPWARYRKRPCASNSDRHSQAIDFSPSFDKFWLSIMTGDTSYAYFDHDADIGIVGRGKTLEAAFAAAAEAMFAIVAEPAAVKPEIAITVEFDETNSEFALVTWLNRLIAEASDRGIALCQFKITQQAGHWQGEAWGKPWRADMERGISEYAKKRQRGKMGALGSGSHYLEVQAVDTNYDARAAQAFGLSKGQILVSIHCGSRGLGHQIGTEYLVSLAKAASRLGITLPDRELACAPVNSPEGRQYRGAMNAAINVALANRQIFTHLTRGVFARLFPDAVLETLYDVSHNTCKLEKHKVGGKERWLYIHRKGATRALHAGLARRVALLLPKICIKG
jgi:SHS2 domain-containing protein